MASLGTVVLGGAVICLAGAYLYWRRVWFFRNPKRVVPIGDHVVSPADGTVVYVRRLMPREDVVMVKKGIVAKLEDILRTDVDGAKWLIGVFMSPFDVHYNRAPLGGRVEEITHYPARGQNRHMTWMHWRTVLKRPPYHAGSHHIYQNERTVTRFTGRLASETLSYYVVQIAGGSVRGIDSFYEPGTAVDQGAIFGMIRIGSQVDLVLPFVEGMRVCVQPGDRVRAGESIIVQSPWTNARKPQS